MLVHLGYVIFFGGLGLIGCIIAIGIIITLVGAVGAGLSELLGGLFGKIFYVLGWPVRLADKHLPETKSGTAANLLKETLLALFYLVILTCPQD